MDPTWKSKFQLKTGKWVFEPSDAGRLVGAKIKEYIESNWVVPDYFYHLKQGGHLSAIRTHLSNTFFVRVDIENFFGSINRSRLTRSLNKRVNYLTAREWANSSAVIAPVGKKKYIVPFGFVQSQVLAALCLHESALGICLRKLSKQENLKISVYVDDIIVSSDSEESCAHALSLLTSAAERAKFKLSDVKREGPANAITAFNIVLSKNNMALTPQRLNDFKNKLAETENQQVIDGIVGYAASVNSTQATELMQ